MIAGSPADHNIKLISMTTRPLLPRWGRALLLAAVLRAQDVPDPAYERAAESYHQGRMAEAEAALKSLLGKHPSDVQVLALLGAVLDSGQRYGEAEVFYQRALRLAPRSASLLNNLGNHYLAAGNAKAAQEFYRRTVGLEARHVNANLHLAQMSVQEKHGVEALAHLDQLSADARAEPMAQLLRGQALALANRCVESADVLGSLQSQLGSDPSGSFSMGLAYAACQRYDQAETAFSRVLQTDPTDFDVLYNLGLVARHAGHLERARQVFEIALKQKPDDPDTLYGLSEVLARSGDQIKATAMLYRLRQLAPERADALLLLANTTAELGYFEEAAASYHEYLRRRPEDEVARREWGFALARAGSVHEALPPLQEFAAKHPKDPRAQYELAIAEAAIDPRKALRRLDQTLEMDPALVPARYSRGVLRLQENLAAAAMADFQFLLKREPENAQLLDWIGQVYLRTDRVPEAADVLKRAVALAPRDRGVLMHYTMALRQLERKDELAAALDAFKRIAANSDTRQRKGLFSFLDLSPDEQRTKYFSFLQTTAAANPADAVLKMRWARALLEQGRVDEAVGVFRDILALATDSTVRGQCGRVLLRYEQYGLAADFLRPLPDARLDLAIAIFHSVSPEAGLSELEKVPPAERKGDYYVLRAQILDALGRPQEAAGSLNRGIRAAPTRADMYFQAAVFLIKHERRDEAVRLLADASRLLPDASELMLARAIALELLERSMEALKLLVDIQSRWPEWDLGYLVHGIVLETAHRSAEAEQALQTAIALGADEATVYYYLAMAITHADPDKMEEAEKDIMLAVERSPEDPNVRWLAGRILVDREKYAPAVEQLQAAVRLQPKSVRAHYLLLTAYRGLGDEEKSAAEANLIKQIGQDSPETEPASPMERLLFTVRPPG